MSIDIKGSFDWYEDKSKGLGIRFISELELEHAYEAISYFPGTWTPFEHGFRRYILPRFPFSVIYKETTDAVFVLTVMHNSRKPGFWKDRI